MTYNDAKQQVAQDVGFQSFYHLQQAHPKAIYRYYEQAAEIYAKSKIDEYIKSTSKSAQPKICIEIEGGIVQSVSTSEPMQYVVVDLDHSEVEEVDWEAEIVPRPSDSVFQNLHEGWEDCHPDNKGVYEAMKAINY